MCGLFGLVRAGTADAARASELLLHLGVWAEERGRDAAGIAVTVPRSTVPAPRGITRYRDVRAGRWRVVKNTGLFRNLWRPDLFTPLDTAQVVLGHTRWATQGQTGRLANASPLTVGRIVGTHNGDIDADALRLDLGLTGRPVGDTDTEVLLQALSVAGSDPEDQLMVLTTLLGRAAVAWSPLGRRDQVFLARAGLSPLTVARDRDGNVYWASNPAWLRRAAVAVGAELDEVLPLREGTLLALRRRAGRVAEYGRWSFVPTVRPRDLRIARIGAWRGFSPADQARDERLLRHRVLSTGGWAGADWPGVDEFKDEEDAAIA